MSGVDNRTVKMQFDNATFKTEAKATKGALEEVDAAVARTGKSRGLLDMAGHMETVRVKAGAMQVAAVTALSNIANRAVNAGLNMAKSLTLDPIKQGFNEYELKMKSIQTILANTKGENLQSVTKALDELNAYSDKTIYNFANMTDSIGKLTTAGISLTDATSTVKGFSNMVALAGGDATAAAGAMEQFGQGLQAGVIKAIDWQSISTRGLGSQHLQRAFFETARAAGELQDVPLSTSFEEWSKASGGFKASLETGWLTSETATKTLSLMTGDITDVNKVMAMGFDNKTAKEMIQIAQNATESATKVRTFTAFMDTMQESLGSGWAKISETIFGNFNKATNLFTNLSDAVGGAIGGFFNYLNAALEGWQEMGGRLAILKTLKNLIAPIGAILKVVAAAWTAAFPSKNAGSGLATVSKLLQYATRPLRVLAELIEGSVGPITTFFRLFKIGGNIIKLVGGSIGTFLVDFLKMVGTKFGGGGGGFIQYAKDIAEAIGKAIKTVSDLLDKGKSLKEAFGKVDIKLPEMPNLPSLSGISGMLGGSTDKAGGIAGLAGGLGSLTSDLKTFNKVDAETRNGLMFNPDATIDGSRVRDVGDAVQDTTTKAKGMGGSVIEMISGAFDKLKSFFSGMSLEDLMSAINLGLIATIGLSVSGFLRDMGKSMEQIGKATSGFATSMGDMAGAITKVGDHIGEFAAAQKREATAKVILNTAIALGILVAALWVLSRIPEDKLKRSLIALAAVGAIFKVTMDALTDALSKIESDKMGVKMVTLGVMMVLFAISISILASAMIKLNEVEWASILKAGAAMYMLTKAMESLAKLTAEDIIKSAFAMIIIAGALLLFAIAIERFAQLKFKVFAEGLFYAGTSLALLAVVMQKFTASLAGAAALVVAVGALMLFYFAIKLFATLDFMVFAKGLIFAGISLALLAVVMQGFTSSLAGAAALVVAVFALKMLFEVISMFATLDWKTFGKGLGMMAIAFITLGALMALMGVFAPLILLGAAALLIFGGAMALLGLGVLLLAKGLGALVLIGAAAAAAMMSLAVGFGLAIGAFFQTLAMEAPLIKNAFLKILQSLIDGLVEAVPMIIDGVKRLFKAVKDQFSGSGGDSGKDSAKGVASSMESSGKSWIEKLRDGIKKMVPKIVTASVEIIGKFLKGLGKKAGELTVAGVDLIVKLIRGISSKADDIVDAAVDLIITLAQGLQDNLFRLVRAGINLIANFLHEVASAIRTGSDKIGAGIKDVLGAMKDVGIDMVKGLIKGLGEMKDQAFTAIGDLATGMIDKAKGLFKIKSPSRIFMEIGKFLSDGLAKGVRDNASAAIVSVASLVSGSIAMASSYVDKFVQDMDQKAIAATARAAGLQAAADKAAAAAEKTGKNKKDDRKANQLQKAADKAAVKAEKREAAAEKARAANERATEFEASTLADQAQMRSEDAAMTIDEAKEAELDAASKREQAKALREQSRKSGVSKKDSDRFKQMAKDLEKSAEKDVKRANTLMALAKTQAQDSMVLQKRANDEAAAAAIASYDQEYTDSRVADEESDAFEKLTDEEKIVERRRQAAALQAKADADLARAKILAFSDLDAANELAAQAIADADRSRDYLREAAQTEKQIADAKDSQSSSVGGTVVNLDPTEAASIAFGNYSSVYDAAYASAAAGQTVEFNQYNTSPEALNPTDVYRNTNNQLAFGASKLLPAA